MRYLKVKRRCNTGDQKTAWAFPDRYPDLHPGEIVKFKEPFTNLFGDWLNVISKQGTVYSIRERDLEEIG